MPSAAITTPKQYPHNDGRAGEDSLFSEEVLGNRGYAEVTWLSHSGFAISN